MILIFSGNCLCSNFLLQIQTSKRSYTPHNANNAVFCHNFFAVVLFANAFFVGTTKAANRVCEPFGLEMIDREPRMDPRTKIEAEEIHRHPLTVGVAGIVVKRPSPTVVNDEAVARPLVDLPALGSERPFVAYARTQSGGEVITVGNSLWWVWVGEAPGNERLLRNLLVRPPRMR